MIARAAASVAFLLIVLTVLGHACELPIGVVLAAHAHEHADEVPHHHPADTDAACDEVLAIPRSTHTSSQPDAVVQAPMHSRVDAVAPPVFERAAPESRVVHRRIPLFLLHATFLI